MAKDGTKLVSADVASKEKDFLLAFYGKTSPTKFDRRASAIAAGYTPRMALWNANRLLQKFEEKGFRECAEAIGVTIPALAVAFKETLDETKGRDRLASLRLALANRGEMTDGASTQKNVTVNQPVMVIVGATSERMDALRRGGIPEDDLEGKAAINRRPTAELPGALSEEVIDVEPALASAANEACRLSAADFGGKNLTEARGSKGPNY
jgi:hypothetical protein